MSGAGDSGHGTGRGDPVIESLDDLLGAAVIPEETLSLAALGGRAVRLVGMTAEERVAVEKACVEVIDDVNADGNPIERRKVDMDALKLATLAMCLRTAGGARFVTGDDRARLSRLPALAVEEAWKVAARLSGILVTKEDKEQGKSTSAPATSIGT